MIYCTNIVYSNLKTLLQSLLDTVWTMQFFHKWKPVTTMTPETRNLLQSWQTRFFVKTYYCWDSVDWCYHVSFGNQTFFKINAGELLKKSLSGYFTVYVQKIQSRNKKLANWKLSLLKKTNNEQQSNCKALDEFFIEDVFNKVPNFFTGFWFKISDYY